MRTRARALLQYLALRGLWVPEIHHFVHELVDDHKVVPYRLFFELFKVFYENLCQAMQEYDDFCCIGISF